MGFQKLLVPCSIFKMIGITLGLIVLSISGYAFAFSKEKLQYTKSFFNHHWKGDYEVILITFSLLATLGTIILLFIIIFKKGPGYLGTIRCIDRVFHVCGALAYLTGATYLLTATTRVDTRMCKVDSLFKEKTDCRRDVHYQEKIGAVILAFVNVFVYTIISILADETNCCDCNPRSKDEEAGSKKKAGDKPGSNGDIPRRGSKDIGTGVSMDPNGRDSPETDEYNQILKAQKEIDRARKAVEKANADIARVEADSPDSVDKAAKAQKQINRATRAVEKANAEIVKVDADLPKLTSRPDGGQNSAKNSKMRVNSQL